MSNDDLTTLPDLAALVSVFYRALRGLGDFELVEAEQAPPVYRRLLAHDDHMTVTVERHHGCPVDVQVLEKHQTDSHYARKILLTCESDNKVVLFGIMRVALELLGAQVCRDIEDENTPLGRILIRHDILRHVELSALWRVTPGDELRQLLAMQPDEETYGRTAMIHIHGHPAVELLEIVTPERTSRNTRA